MTRTQAPKTAEEPSVVAKLSTLDRFLAAWILLAMGLGLGLGRLIPGLNDALAQVEIGGISLPIAVGLLIMMYPVLAKVRYDSLDAVTGDRRLMSPRWSSTGSSARRSCSRWPGSSCRICPSTAPV
ncbi:hypothetical protein SMICM304S_09496 [Streptomyces microflavus]